jgi:acyl-CoA synthetase (NDP forming)
MDLTKLLKPSSIAVIGATTRPNMAGRATASVVKSRISDRVYYVNPNRDEVDGRKCYKSLCELPEIVDQLLICTPAEAVAKILEEGGKLGVKSAVVLASGFEEEKTPEAQRRAQELKEVCEKYGILLCGPNGLGYVNVLDQIYGGVANKSLLEEDIALDSGFAIVAQSGYITMGFFYPDSKYVAYSVSAGNCTVCGLEDYLLYFAQDDRVTCIAVYVEEFSKPDVLVKALRLAAQKGKPVVALKSGASEKGRLAAASHTGSLAGDYKSYESIFKKFGVVLTRSLQDFVSTTRMFAVLGGNLPKKVGIGAINFSGGENTMCADSCERMGLNLPNLSPATVDAIKPLIPSYATASNPLDATTTMFTDVGNVTKLFEALCNDESIGLITLGNDIAMDSEQKDVTCIKVLSDLAAQGNLLPTFVVPSFEKPRNPEIRRKYEESGIPVLSTGDMAYTSIKHLCDFVSYDSTMRTLDLAVPGKMEGCQKKALSEGESKMEIADLGIRIPKQAVATTEEELEICLTNIPFPVVLKVDSPDILHKTNAGGVKLGINSKEEARRAYREILDSCRAYMPSARIDGILVQEMVKPGVEIIVGVKNDPLFGPMLLVGLGGVYVEVFKDISLYSCPLNKVEALDMLKSLKGYQLLAGYRGSKPCDINALVELMLKVSDYAVANKNVLAELDLNPVFVYEDGKGVCVVDALIVKRTCCE